MPAIEPDILGWLYRQHAPALRLYARQWPGSAEDLVQEAFVKLAQQSPPPERVLPWLYRVVRNAAVSAARADRRRRRHETRAAERAAVWFEAAPGAALDGRAASAALHGLPLEQREAIVAHLWGGLTFTEIAAVAGCSSSTAHRWYVAGLNALRERLGVTWPNTTPAPR